MVWNITMIYCKNTLQKVLFHSVPHFLITRESEDEQKPVLVSNRPPQKLRQKITFNGNLNTLAPKHATELPRMENEICIPYSYLKTRQGRTR